MGEQKKTKGTNFHARTPLERSNHLTTSPVDNTQRRRSFAAAAWNGPESKPPRLRRQ
jgi:hypothetical protein